MEYRDPAECYRELQALKDRARELYASLEIDRRQNRLEELEQESMKGDLWQDQERFTAVNKELSRLKKNIDPWNELLMSLDEAVEMVEMAMEEKDQDILQDFCGKVTKYENQIDELETLELFNGDDDLGNAFVTIHPGAGGTESQDWAEMLFRMYYRWAEKKQFTINVVDYTPGDEAGIKSATLLVKGDYAFGFLKGEVGVHRLVRISPFDANKRRHTSFASVEVVPEVEEDIEIEIKDSDLKIDTYRASGAGGQHVNKTDSAVRITHLPTGIVVQCQNERSQHKNKAFAMKVLKARLFEQKQSEQDDIMQEKMGEKKDIAWGNQIRSYVFQPYTMVKDHRTGEETGSVEYVFDGDLDRFLYSYLREFRTS